MKELIAKRGGTSQKGLSYELTGSSRSQFVARIGKSPGLKCQSGTAKGGGRGGKTHRPQKAAGPPKLAKNIAGYFRGKVKSGTDGKPHSHKPTSPNLDVAPNVRHLQQSQQPRDPQKSRHFEHSQKLGYSEQSQQSQQSGSLNDNETIKRSLEPDNLKIDRLCPSAEASRLSYGLERILFNPGVHWLRDLRTNVYNFDPFLRTLPSPEDFKFEAIPPFIPASKDNNLLQLATSKGCKYVTSTSSISQSMSSIYFVLSKMRPLNLDCLSQPFAEEPRTFTLLTRSPNAVLLKPHGDGIRSITVEKYEEGETVLSKLGQVMERLLTEPKDNFVKMLRDNPDAPTIRDSEAYAYTAAGDILLRSQLDCHDPRLPHKTFDLKTRAALPIRMDIQNHLKYRDYRITNSHGLYASFEREYFDMCRSAFLKYNFQVRIGDMDGIFVAYHNTFELFGFQYVSRVELDERIYGNSKTGDATFNLILQVYNEILATVVPLYPAENTIRLTFAPDKAGNRLTLYAEDAGPNGGVGGGRDLRQFGIILNSTLNGFKADQVLLDPRGNDVWRVNMSMTLMEPNQSDYDSVRSKLIFKSESDDDRGLAFLRMSRKSGGDHPISAEPHGPEILAPWTVIS